MVGRVIVMRAAGTPVAGESGCDSRTEPATVMLTRFGESRTTEVGLVGMPSYSVEGSGWKRGSVRSQQCIAERATSA